MAELQVYKRGCNWEYRFEIASENGKRKFAQKCGFKTKKEALEQGTAAFNAFNSTGQTITISEIGVADYLNEWLENIQTSIKPNTLAGYRKKINSYIIPRLGNYKVKNLTASILQKFINDLFDNGYSRNTLINIKAILSSSLNYAIEPMHYIISNPMNFVKLPSPRVEPHIPTRSNPHVFIEKEDMQRIFERFPERSTAHIPLMLGYKCGLRLGEAFGICWEDIDLDKKTIEIKRQVQWKDKNKDNPEDGSYWYFSKPKYDSCRTITIDSELCELLKRERERQRKAQDYYDELYVHNFRTQSGRLNTVGDGEEVHLLCIRESGDFTQPRIMQHTSHIINSDLNIKFDFHLLRHTHCSMLLTAGAKPKYVQERLGHKNIQVTLQIYQHLTEEMKSQGDSILEEMF